mmetsp:Transcript_41835/g.125013  ORF Transcript_41835/g.125013 Transcript_41835/m.125013 type:complete len:222 (+) Transcript_41835:266-931(+)
MTVVTILRIEASLWLPVPCAWPAAARGVQLPCAGIAVPAVGCSGHDLSGAGAGVRGGWAVASDRHPLPPRHRGLLLVLGPVAFGLGLSKVTGRRCVPCRGTGTGCPPISNRQLRHRWIGPRDDRIACRNFTRHKGCRLGPRRGHHAPDRKGALGSRPVSVRARARARRRGGLWPRRRASDILPTEGPSALAARRFLLARLGKESTVLRPGARRAEPPSGRR